MIKSFRDKDSELLFGGKSPRRFRSFQAQAERKLEMLEAAHAVEDLRQPPGNRLEVLKGDRKGHYSIRINDQWRMCFRFEGGHVYDVEIVDYH